MEKKQFLEAGEIVNTHGIRGEVKILPWVDSAEFLLGLKTLYIDQHPYDVAAAKVHKGCLIAALAGVEDVNAAMALKGKIVRFSRGDVKLPKGRIFLADLIGAAVVTETGAPVGTLTDVIENPSQNVYVVQGETEHLIPAVPEFVLHIDAEQGVVTVHLIEGM